MIVLIAVMLYASLMIALFFYLAKNAPEGYEDEKGFHYGKENDKC